MSPAKEAQALISSEIQRAGIEVDEVTQKKLLTYVEMICRWAQRVRITGSRQMSPLITRQLVDAFYAAALLGEGAKDIVDVGSGAGLPAIPLALMRPELRFSLVEANQRKCSFLRSAIFELSLQNVEVYDQRIEALSLPAQDIALSKATWAPAAWRDIAKALVGRQGTIFVFAVDRAALGEERELSLERISEYRLVDGSPRLLAVYRHPAP